MPDSTRDKINAHRKMILNRMAANRCLSNCERAHEAAKAIELMENGTYGFCVSCGLQIPERRLFDRPETTRRSTHR